MELAGTGPRALSVDLCHAAASKNFVAEGDLRHMNAEGLSTSVGGNRWRQSAASLLLRRKLISVSVRGGRDPEELHAMPPVPSMHPRVDTLCTKCPRCRNVALVLVYTSCHADLNEDKRVVQCLRELVPPDCVVVYPKPDPNRTADHASDEGSHGGSFGKFAFRAAVLPRAKAAPDASDNLNDQLQQQSGAGATRHSLQSHPGAVHLQQRRRADEPSAEVSGLAEVPTFAGSAASELAAAEAVAPFFRPGVVAQLQATRAAPCATAFHLA